jgi:HEAT repeat protein
MFIEDIQTLLLWALALVLTLIAAFLVFLARRRVQRHRFFIAKDQARARYKAVIREATSPGANREVGLKMLSSGTEPPERMAISEELLKCTAEKDRLLPAVELMYAMGYVDEWAREGFGKRLADALIRRSAGADIPDADLPRAPRWLNFPRKMRIFAIPRANAIDKLSKLPLQNCRAFLKEALIDPAAMVRKIAVAKLAEKRDPSAVPLLCEELRLAVTSTHDVSLRDVRGALAMYQIEDLDLFIPWLTHPEKRVRLFVADTVAEICRQHLKTRGNPARNDFSPAMYRTILNQVSCDDFPDVRARAAHVIRFFNDSESFVALRSLLKDSNEFVRMHTLRATRDRKFTDLMDDVLERLSDSKWRVRESAVQTLASLGDAGLDKLLKYFIDATDQYASEAIADEIQRGGYIRDMLVAIANQRDDAGLALAACDKMVLLQKNSVLVAALATVTNVRVQVALIDSLALSPTDEFLQVLDAIANSSQTTASSRALALLKAYSERADLAATAAAGQRKT